MANSERLFCMDVKRGLLPVKKEHTFEGVWEQDAEENILA
jgi:hypothetical protein